VADLGPERCRLTGGGRRRDGKAGDLHADVRLPPEAQLDDLAGVQAQVGDVLAGKPALPPVLDDRTLDGWEPTRLDLDVARRIHPQLVVARDGGGERPRPVGGAAGRPRDLLPDGRLGPAETR